MTLTIGTGPFGEHSIGTFNFEVRVPGDHVMYLEDSPRRVRARFNGETVADSRRVKLLHEAGLLPVYYFPEEDVSAWTSLKRATTLPTVLSRATHRTGP